jgi:anti-sigma factor RsiW
VFLQTRAPREKASAALRERVLARIAEERERSTGNSGKRAHSLRLSRHRSLILGLAALLALSVIAGGLWLIERRAGVKTQELASILIDDHAHSLPVVTEIASSDTGVVQAWFQERLGFAFHLPPLRDPALQGGRLCNLQGRRAALVLYRHPQSKVSLFILDGSDVELPEARLIALDGKRCLVDTRKGYNAVLWKERGLLYGLVSDLRSAELLQLAEQF